MCMLWHTNKIISTSDTFNLFIFVVLGGFSNKGAHFQYLLIQNIASAIFQTTALRMYCEREHQNTKEKNSHNDKCLNQILGIYLGYYNVYCLVCKRCWTEFPGLSFERIEACLLLNARTFSILESSGYFHFNFVFSAALFQQKFVQFRLNLKFNFAILLKIRSIHSVKHAFRFFFSFHFFFFFHFRVICTFVCVDITSYPLICHCFTLLCRCCYCCCC